jgi:hypothetical protein
MPDDKQWYLFDDSRVEETAPEGVSLCLGERWGAGGVAAACSAEVHVTGRLGSWAGEEGDSLCWVHSSGTLVVPDGAC